MYVLKRDDKRLLIVSFWQVISNGTSATSGGPFQGYNGMHRLHAAGGGGQSPYGGANGYPPPPSQHNNPSPGTPPHLLPPTTQNGGGGGLPHPVIEAVNNPLIHPAWQVISENWRYTETVPNYDSNF